jgi:4-aminobutyrate aminotransferase
MTGSVREHIYYDVSDTFITAGEGIYLYDGDGSRYIDCGSGTFNLSLGYRHPEIIAVVKEQADKLIHVTSSFQTAPVNDLVQRLVEVSPDNLTKVHLKVPGGSEANEGAIKMAQYVTGRREVITLFRSHLGQTMMTAGLSGNAFRKAPFPAVFPGGLQVPDPYCYRCFYKQQPESSDFLCVQRINDFIDFASAGQVACVLVEPISGNGGNIVPPHGYFAELRRLCDERGIVLIFDEIQTGIGRTGEMFAADYFGVRPDAMTLAKGLGGSGLQVAAILTDARLSGLDGHHHSFTYGANLLAAAAASKTIEIVGRPGFLENVRTVGAGILGRLRDMQGRLPFIGDVRGVGLMIGVELVGPDGEPAVELTNAVAKAAPGHGLMVRTSRYGFGNVVKIRPPLIISPSQAEDLCDRFEALLGTFR